MKKADQVAQKPTSKQQSEGFTVDEKAAMKERAKELKAEARANQDRQSGENDVGQSLCRYLAGDDRTASFRVRRRTIAQQRVYIKQVEATTFSISAPYSFCRCASWWR